MKSFDEKPSNTPAPIEYDLSYLADDPEPRHFKELGLAVIIRSYIKIIGKIKNKYKSKRPVLEFISGDDFTRLTGKWSDLKRAIDRDNDKYTEIITDKDNGDAIKHCEEPLSKHSGHGSAR